LEVFTNNLITCYLSPNWQPHYHRFLQSAHSAAACVSSKQYLTQEFHQLYVSDTCLSSWPTATYSATRKASSKFLRRSSGLRESYSKASGRKWWI